MEKQDEIEAIEIQLLLEGIFRRYGHDFRDYAPLSLRRRILQILPQERVKTVSGLQEKILHDPVCIERFIQAVSVSTSSMFRDPEFFLAFRKKAVPHLCTYPFIRI
jgi:chemotaxis protein methyltransferase CheR